MRKARTYRLGLGVGDFISLSYYGGSEPDPGDEIEVLNARDDKIFKGKVVKILPARGQYVVKVIEHMKKTCGKIEGH